MNLIDMIPHVSFVEELFTTLLTLEPQTLVLDPDVNFELLFRRCLKAALVTLIADTFVVKLNVLVQVLLL